MTDNMKSFLEAVSQDKEFLEKYCKAESKEALVALAAEKGFTLTEEDLKLEEHSSEVSDDELNAVAGGKTCACVAGGGGEASGASLTCACVLGGLGDIEVPVARCGVHYTHIKTRCACAIGGGGEDHAI